jgi:3-hydroxybutyryl-CoA dehydrogenase
MKKIGIYGSGQIGRSLGVLFSGLGLDVTLFSRHIEQTMRELALNIRMAKKLNQELKLDEYSLKVTDNIHDLKECDLVIESVSENSSVKKICLSEIATIIKESTIVASTTSTMSITELSGCLNLRENFIGLHFFNPPTLINFLEIISGEHTSVDTIERTVAFLNSINRKYILLHKENPGFIVNRALFLLLNEAVYELYEGLASAKDIDNAFKQGLNHPMGPIELCDFIGLDVVLDILTTLYEEYGDTKYRPCYLIKQKVRAGKLGKKSKEGFYKY